jgi:hypothetical protein
MIFLLIFFALFLGASTWYGWTRTFPEATKLARDYQYDLVVSEDIADFAFTELLIPYSLILFASMFWPIALFGLFVYLLWKWIYPTEEL